MTLGARLSRAGTLRRPGSTDPWLRSGRVDHASAVAVVEAVAPGGLRPHPGPQLVFPDVAAAPASAIVPNGLNKESEKLPRDCTIFEVGCTFTLTRARLFNPTIRTILKIFLDSANGE